MRTATGDDSLELNLAYYGLRPMMPCIQQAYLPQPRLDVANNKVTHLPPKEVADPMTGGIRLHHSRAEWTLTIPAEGSGQRLSPESGVESDLISGYRRVVAE